jgi:hypothetical protein
MESVLSDIEDINVYINDVGALSSDWDHHINLLATSLHRLREKGFTINPLKCEWAIKETDWLGYWLTPQDCKSWKKKIGIILRMDHPCNATGLRIFIGCVNYYCDMWQSYAHILQLLMDESNLKKKASIKCRDEMQ